MQIPILNGIYTDEGPDFRTSYPVNLVPVPKDNGIAKGYLRPAPGLVEFATGPGTDRGGINWNGTMHRVMGSKLVSVSAAGAVTELGEVGNASGALVTFDYSFDRLAVVSDGALFYWDGSTLSQVTDPDLGTVLDMVWVDGYFMATDGEFLVVTDINDPMSVNPLKYTSSEANPDPITALVKIHNEVYALNRYTIEVFDNVGGSGFPFQRIEGAQIMRGAIGTHAACVFLDSVAFVGGGTNEPVAVYIGKNGNSSKVSTQEIDKVLRGYTETELADVYLEAKNDQNHLNLLLHLPDRTLVYDAAASEAVGEPVWYTLTSALQGFGRYRARSHVWCYDRWLAGDPTASKLATLTDSISSHYGSKVRWEFGTIIVYNEGRRAIFQQLELVALTGRVALGTDPTISTAYSIDGENWSQERIIKVGKIGERMKRLCWFHQGFMRNWRIQRFRGTSDAHIAVARLEAAVEGLAV